MANRISSNTGDDACDKIFRSQAVMNSGSRYVGTPRVTERREALGDTSRYASTRSGSPLASASKENAQHHSTVFAA